MDFWKIFGWNLCSFLKYILNVFQWILGCKFVRWEGSSIAGRFEIYKPNLFISIWRPFTYKSRNLLYIKSFWWPGIHLNFRNLGFQIKTSITSFIQYSAPMPHYQPCFSYNKVIQKLWKNLGMDRISGHFENQIPDFLPDIRWVPDTGYFRHRQSYLNNWNLSNLQTRVKMSYQYPVCQISGWIFGNWISSRIFGSWISGFLIFSIRLDTW